MRGAYKCINPKCGASPKCMKYISEGETTLIRIGNNFVTVTEHQFTDICLAPKWKYAGVRTRVRDKWGNYK